MSPVLRLSFDADLEIPLRFHQYRQLRHDGDGAHEYDGEYGFHGQHVLPTPGCWGYGYDDATGNVRDVYGGSQWNVGCNARGDEHDELRQPHRRSTGRDATPANEQRERNERRDVTDHENGLQPRPGDQQSARKELPTELYARKTAVFLYFLDHYGDPAITQQDVYFE